MADDDHRFNVVDHDEIVIDTLSSTLTTSTTTSTGRQVNQDASYTAAKNSSMKPSITIPLKTSSEEETSSVLLPEDEVIDYDLVYALHTFVANLEGQVCVLKGDSLELLDDSNSYWWLVKCLKTDEVYMYQASRCTS